MKVEELFAGIAVRYGSESRRDAADIEITDVTVSPETGGENVLYVAVKTALSDGGDGLCAAYARGCRLFLCAHDAFPGEGAVVLIAEDPEALLGELTARVSEHPARALTVFGITGTAGKTSVALLTEQVLRFAGFSVGSLTTDGLSIDGKTEPSAGVRAPNAVDVQHALRRMADAGAEVAVLEFSSYQLLHRAAQGIPFTAVLLTNLSPRHIGPREHPDFASYAAAKATLFAGGAPFAVLPAGLDFPCRAGRVLRFGADGDFDAEERAPFLIRTLGCGTRFLLSCAEGKESVTLPVPGDIAVENALCAAALARIVGADLKEIAAGLCAARVAGRLACVCAQSERLIYIDAAFCAEDLQTALRTLRPLAEGRLSVLLGSVGGRAVSRRAALGRAAGDLADFVYLTADDPDTEDPVAICNAMREGMTEPDRSVILPDRREAILRAMREMRPGDVLLLAGKGSAATQLIDGCRRPFSEREIVREGLAELRW